MLNNELTREELNNNLNNAKLVYITSGESNGRDDSDGFEAYADLSSGKVYFYQWTTRFSCNLQSPAHVRKDELTAAELDAYGKIVTDFALELLTAQSQKNTYCGNVKFGQFAGIPCTVTGGRKFRGEGELVGIKTSYYTYGRSYRFRGYEVENTKAIIKTADGSIKEATAKYVHLDYSKIDLRGVAERFAGEIISEEGYNRNAVRYSNSKRVGDFVLEFFQKAA